MDKRDLEKYDLWTWNDERNEIVPIELNDKEMYYEFFCRAFFNAKNGKTYLGYLNSELFSIGIFVENKLINFNCNIPDYALISVRSILNDKNASLEDFFPVTYKTDTKRFTSDLPHEGIFDIK